MPQPFAPIISPPPPPCHGSPVAMVWCLAFARQDEATLSFHEDGHTAVGLMRPWLDAQRIREAAVEQAVLDWADRALSTLGEQERGLHYAESHLSVAGGRLSLAAIPVQTILDA